MELVGAATVRLSTPEEGLLLGQLLSSSPPQAPARTKKKGKEGASVFVILVCNILYALDNLNKSPQCLWKKQYKSIYRFNESKTSEFDIEKNAASVYVEKTNSTRHHQHTEQGHIFLGLLASFTDYQPQVAANYHITQDVGDRTKLGERQSREGSRQQ